MGGPRVDPTPEGSDPTPPGKPPEGFKPFDPGAGLGSESAAPSLEDRLRQQVEVSNAFVKAVEQTYGKNWRKVFERNPDNPDAVQWKEIEAGFDALEDLDITDDVRIASYVPSREKEEEDESAITRWGVQQGNDWLLYGFKTRREAERAYEDYNTRTAHEQRQTEARAAKAKEVKEDIAAREARRETEAKERKEWLKREARLRATQAAQKAARAEALAETPLRAYPSDVALTREPLAVRVLNGGYAVFQGEQQLTEPGSYADAELTLRLNPRFAGLAQATTPLYGTPLEGMAEAKPLIKRLREADPIDALEETLQTLSNTDPQYGALLKQYLDVLGQGWPTARAHAAIAALYETHPVESDKLRALTAFVDQSDLPVVEHFMRLDQLVDEYLATDQSGLLHGLEGKLPVLPSAATVDVEELLAAEKGLGWGNPLSENELTIHDYVLHRARYFTKTLGAVVSPLLGRANRSKAEQMQADARSRAAQGGLTGLDRTMQSLMTLAAASPEQSARLPLGAVESWLARMENNKDVTPLGELGEEVFAVLTEHNAERRIADDKQKAALKQTPEGRLRESFKRLRAMHDAGGLPLGDLSLEYDAKREEFALREQVVSLDPDTTLVVQSQKTGQTLTLREYVREYIADKHKAWRQTDAKTGEETAFWRKHVINLLELESPLADPSTAKKVPFRTRHITDLGYLAAEAQKLPPPSNDFHAFNAGLAALMLHADKTYVAENPKLLADKVISRYHDEGRTYGAWQAEKRKASLAQGYERRAVQLLTAFEDLAAELKADPAKVYDIKAIKERIAKAEKARTEKTAEIAEAKDEAGRAALRQQRAVISAEILAWRRSDPMSLVNRIERLVKETDHFGVTWRPRKIAGLQKQLREATVPGERVALERTLIKQKNQQAEAKAKRDQYIEAIKVLQRGKPTEAMSLYEAASAVLSEAIRPMIKRQTKRAGEVEVDIRVKTTPLYEMFERSETLTEEGIDALDWKELIHNQGVDIGSGDLAVVADAKMMRQQDLADRGEARFKAATARIGSTSTAATGDTTTPLPTFGVRRHEGSEAHALVKKTLDRLQLNQTQIDLYNSKDLSLFEDELWRSSPTSYQLFAKRLQIGETPDAAVAFINGKVLLYYNDNLKGDALAHALSHELGHVVYRSLLDGERRKGSAVWNRLLSAYYAETRSDSFMEWFADEVAAWNRSEKTVSGPLEAFWRRVNGLVVDMLRALGLSPKPGAVAAYLDGIALKQRQIEYTAFLDAVRGEAGYDLLGLQMTHYSANNQERLVMDSHDMDFLGGQEGFGRRTVAKVRDWIDAHQTARHLVGIAGSGWKWADDALSSTNGWLRSQGIEEMQLKADMLDRGARQATVELSTDAEIDALARDDGKWKGLPKTTIATLKERAAFWRAREGVLGVKLVKYIDDNGFRQAEVVPLWRESFQAALTRLSKGVWGAGANGFYDLLKEVNGLGSAEAVNKLGEELLRGAPDSALAGKLDRWLKRFFNAYVKPGFVGAYSGQTHIGTLQNWGLARYYSPEKVEADREAFIKLLETPNPETGYTGMSRRAAEVMTYRIVNGNELITTEGETASGVKAGLPPGAPSSKSRRLDISVDKLMPFLETDVTKVLPRYVHSMIRRVEWEKRFSDETASYDKEGNVRWNWRSNHFAETVRQAAVFNHPELGPKRSAYVLQKIQDIDEAYLGRYGAMSTDPRVRTGMSIIQSGVSWLTLPFAVLSNFTDLAGPLVRSSGDVKAAWNGLRDAWRAMRKHDALWDAAEANAVIFRETRDTFTASLFDSPWLTETAQKANDVLFRYNGMQAFTTFSRLASWAASGHWLRSLAAGRHPDTARWLKDIGLEKKELTTWVNEGMKDYQEGDGYESTTYKVMLARQRFVAESAFQPGAGQRPLAASHPYAMLVWHLKQFAWSYYTQLLKPALREVRDNPRVMGKVAAVAPLALLFPLAMAGMGLRDELRYGLWRDGEAPKRGDDFFDQFGAVISRTGVLGPLQLLIDADTQQSWGRSFVFSLLGPTSGKIDSALKAESWGDTISGLVPGLSILPEEQKMLMRLLGG